MRDYPPSRRRFHWMPIVLFLILGAGYYFSHRETNPYTGRKQVIDISPEQEAQLGLQSYEQVLEQSDIVQSGPEKDLVESVGRKIAQAVNNPDFQWEFNLIRSPQINAFCLPGGKVAVYSGILPVAQNADGLAVVMGHEIAHALSRHGAERLAQERIAQFGQMAMRVAVGDMDIQQQRALMGAFGLGSQYGVLLPFSRKHESEADYIGLIVMARACFHPEVAVDFWRRMSEANSGQTPPQFASTHPSDTTRIAQLEKWLPEAQAERAKYCDR